ncbi:unnamed protein product [Closterium sp. NIES-53]
MFLKLLSLPYSNPLPACAHTQLHCNSASLSEEELETHTIAAWKEEKLALATPLDAPHTPARRPLIYVGPDETLRKVAEVLLTRGLAMVPVLYYPEARTSSSAAAAAANAASASVAEAPPPPQLLHLASLAGILKCITRSLPPSLPHSLPPSLLPSRPPPPSVSAPPLGFSARLLRYLFLPCFCYC